MTEDGLKWIKKGLSTQITALAFIQGFWTVGSGPYLWIFGSDLRTRLFDQDRIHGIQPWHSSLHTFTLIAFGGKSLCSIQVDRTRFKIVSMHLFHFQDWIKNVHTFTEEVHVLSFYSYAV